MILLSMSLSYYILPTSTYIFLLAFNAKNRKYASKNFIIHLLTVTMNMYDCQSLHEPK